MGARGTPEYLFETVANVFQALLAATRADVPIFGHTREPYHKGLNGHDLVNSGSAGKPK